MLQIRETTCSISMTIEFKLPDVAEGVETVDVVEVLVAEKDVIEVGQPVCEVETEKAVTEIECSYAGTVSKIHVVAGDTIAIGQLLLTIEGTADAPADSTSEASAGTQSEEAEASPAAADETPTSLAGESSDPKPTRALDQRAAGDGKDAERLAPRPASESAPTPDAGSAAAELSPRPPAPAGPATRRLARKLGVDLHDVNGSGSGGRILAEDVESWVRNRLEQAPTGSSPEVPPLPDFARWGPVERQAMNKIARTSADRLGAAWVTIPHVTQHDLADVTELEATRRRYIKSKPDQPKVTMTAIVVKAVIGALRDQPQFNSSIDVAAGELIVKDYVHIGVAVNTPHGLVVPVIRDCDEKNVLEVAAELVDLAAKARDRKLKPDDMQGGTFTITNLGGIGGTAFTPIVNWPEVAILGLSRSQRVLQFVGERVVERLMLPLSLSYDHRVVNGADAARFVVQVSNSLSNFIELF